MVVLGMAVGSVVAGSARADEPTPSPTSLPSGGGESSPPASPEPSPLPTGSESPSPSEEPTASATEPDAWTRDDIDVVKVSAVVLVFMVSLGTLAGLGR